MVGTMEGLTIDDFDNSNDVMIRLEYSFPERYSKPYYPGHYACIGMSEQISRHAAEGN
jgi:hypothetical protein